MSWDQGEKLLTTCRFRSSPPEASDKVRTSTSSEPDASLIAFTSNPPSANKFGQRVHRLHTVQESSGGSMERLRSQPHNHKANSKGHPQSLQGSLDMAPIRLTLKKETRWSPRTRMQTRSKSYICPNDTLVGHSCGTLLWVTLVGNSCGTLLRDTPVALL